MEIIDENMDDEKKDNDIKLLGGKYKPENELEQEEATLHSENRIIWSAQTSSQNWRSLICCE